MPPPPNDSERPGGQGPLARFALVVATVFDWIGRLVLWASAAGLLTMTLIIGWHVFARRVLNDTPHWSETSAVLIMFWYSLLGAAIGVRANMHIGLVFVREQLPRRGRLALDVVINLFVAAFGVLLFWYGMAVVERFWGQTIPTVGISTGYRYLPFPIAGVLIFLFAMEHAARSIAGQEVKRAWS